MDGETNFRCAWLGTKIIEDAVGSTDGFYLQERAYHPQLPWILNHVYTYLDYDYKATPLEKAYSFNPITEGLTPDQQKKILGMGCQMWGEFIPTVESMNYKVYPRIAAYAEDGWTPAENKDYQRFLKSLPYFLGKWKAAGIQYGPLTAESAK